MLKIGYITAQTPFGKREPFILEEMLAMLDLGIDLIVVPRNPPKVIFHKEGEKLIPHTISLPLLNGKIFFYFLKSVISNPKLWKIIGLILSSSRRLKVVFKNLAVLPKGVYIAKIFQIAGVGHIHCHWGSTTATLGWIVSEITKIPWSFTLHRWDIYENNLLHLKVKDASFVRCISEDGKRDLYEMVGNKYEEKIKVIPMGVRREDKSLRSVNVDQKHMKQKLGERNQFVIACPGDFIPKKGQRFLIEAIAILQRKGVDNLRVFLIGEGPLESELREMVQRLNLCNTISFIGFLPHSHLLEIYKNGEVDAVVLPSIVTEKGDKEGIPVALMEAMAFGIPVISTKTGGIPELLSNGAGIVVEPESSEKLAEAILRLIEDDILRGSVGEKGKKKVEEDFDINKNVKRLIILVDGAKI